MIGKVRNAFAHKLHAKDFSAQQIKDLIAKLKIPDKYPIEFGPEDKGLLRVDNPSPLQLAETFLKASSLPDIATPRNKFIRAAELLSGLMLALTLDPSKPIPLF
jgi:hypothetical protein